MEMLASESIKLDSQIALIYYYAQSCTLNSKYLLTCVGVYNAPIDIYFIHYIEKTVTLTSNTCCFDFKDLINISGNNLKRKICLQ